MAQSDLRTRYSTLLEHMSEIVVWHEIVYADGEAVDYRILEANAAWERLTGQPRATVQGRLASEVYGTGTPPYLEIYARVASTGASEVFQTYFPPLDTHFRVTALSIEAGTFVTVSFDVSEHVHLEQQIRDSEARFRTLFERSVDGIIVADAATRRVLDANSAMTRVLGWSREEMLSMSVGDFHPPEARERIMGLFEAHVRGERQLSPELPFLHRDGSLVYLDTAATMMTLGGVSCLVGTLRDATERIQARAERETLEAQVLQAQKLESLGVLAGGIAHDFNNLLVGVLGNASLALLDLPRSSPARRSIHDIETSARRAADLCRQLLAYSGKGRFVIRKLHLNEIIEEMVHLLQVSTSKSAVLRLDLAPELPRIEADATQIRQVIMNLITNASEAIGERSGIISVATGATLCDRDDLRGTFYDEELAEGLYAWVEISDTGCGMDRATQERMFDPFFTTKFTGRGLGLAATLGIVRGHAGTLDVRSKPGRGTVIRVLFPAVEHSEGGVTQPEDPPRPAVTEGLVLLVDDEETVRAVGASALERIGFEVLLAEDGRQAVELFERHAAELALVILDLTMPHMGGEEAFREMRRIRPDIRVLLSSGYNEQHVVELFEGAGLAGFLQKPWRAEELEAAIRRVLA